MHIETIEVSMAPDGTYVVQEVRYVDEGRRVLRTVSSSESIPGGLRALADAIEQEALSEFRRG